MGKAAMLGSSVPLTLARPSIRGNINLPEDVPLTGAEDLQPVPDLLVGMRSL